MAKRVFFSFHYQDVSDFRANVVRNSWQTHSDRQDAGFFDASIWETAKKTSAIALKRLINKELRNTSVTCVLIGSSTYKRRWVRYEIMCSFKKNNKIIGIHINSIRGKDGKTKARGENPLDYLGVEFSSDGRSVTLFEYEAKEWKEYTELDSSSSYSLDHVAPVDRRGNFYRLSEITETYDWQDDNGYENLSSWVL